MIRYIILSFIFYWLFRFIFNYVLPIFRTMRQVKEQVRGFQDRTGTRESSYPNNPYGNTSARRPQQESKPKAGEYIDFEEIK